MDVNKALLELARGEFSFHIPSLSTYLPLAVKLINREPVEVSESPSAINFIDTRGNVVSNASIFEGEYDEPVIGFVNMIGPAMKYSGLCTRGVDAVITELDLMESLDNVVATILNIDGPGGSTAAIGLIEDFKARKTKPIVASCDLCASAHYWSAVSLADHVMANNNVSAQFGSVGVMVSFIDSREHLEKMGYKFHEIYAPESEHKNEAFKLALEGKYDMIKEEHLSPTAKKFQNAVRNARPNLKEEVGVLTGKTFEAEKALEYGMIDSIGTLQDAIQTATMLAEIKRVTINS